MAKHDKSLQHLIIYIFATIIGFVIAFIFSKFHHDTKNTGVDNSIIQPTIVIPQTSVTTTTQQIPVVTDNVKINYSNSGFVTNRPAVVL